ncbi:MAG: choice-of-anchor I family protein [Thermoguttaceae bacterium]
MKMLVLCLATLGLLAGQAFAAGPPLEDVTLVPLGTYDTGVFDESAAEIVAYHAKSKRLFITNAFDGAIDVVDIHDVTAPELLFQIPTGGGGPTSVAVHPRRGLIAVAVMADTKTDDGTVEFFSTNGEPLGSVGVGALPDMVVWTHDGRKVLVANEGEPSDDYLTDPEGSVSIITLGVGQPDKMVQQATVQTAGFSDGIVGPGVRIYGPGASAAQDLEPEYIAVSKDDKTAWVTCQENNAIAMLDVETAQFQWVRSLGYKDHSLAGNALDASNKDDGINIANWPVLGMYQPDAIATYRVGNDQYLITANEGDAREYVIEDPEDPEEEIDIFVEETRGKKLDLDPTVFPDAETLQENENLGRLKVTTSYPAVEGEAGYAEIYSFGTRSFSIWTAEGDLVFDSGEQFAQITAAFTPELFNATNDEDDPDARSDDKGCEVESVTLGKINGRTIAFIGLERIGGVMIYDVSNPVSPTFCDYVNNRVDGEVGPDLGPEGLTFIPAGKSPIDEPLLVVANEVSGTTTIFVVIAPDDDDDDDDDDDEDDD